VTQAVWSVIIGIMNISTLIEQLEAIRLHYGDNFEVKMRVDDDMQFGYELNNIGVEVRKECAILIGEVWQEQDQ
jgi:hypothetical protein